MLLIKLLFLPFFFYLGVVFGAEVADESVDREKVYLYRSTVTDEDIRFFIEKYKTPEKSVFEIFNLKADNELRKWEINESFSEEKPVFDVLEPFELTKNDYSSLHDLLSNPGLDSNFSGVSSRFSKVSCSRDFLDELKKLPKPVNIDSDYHKYILSPTTIRNIFVASVISGLIVYHHQKAGNYFFYSKL
jgi:hypothetical protein